VEIQDKPFAPKDMNEITPDDENLRVYTALLQNQVLGIRNPNIINKLSSDHSKGFQLTPYNSKFNVLSFN
jgi:hypothetical protein